MKSLLLFVCSFLPVIVFGDRAKPNVVYILADDLGYGDLKSMNPEGKIKTPGSDQMAREGMVFTDAHSNSAVCTPTRYGILTGRYAFRSRMKKGVLNGYSSYLIENGRMTVPSFLQNQGYHTAFIGKWHLGWDWAKNGEKIDYSKPVENGPKEKGFEYSYGHCGSLDMAPYVWVENGMPTAVPTKETGRTKKESKNGWWRKGPTSPDFDHEDVLPNLTRRAVKYVKEQVKNEKPFFLYLALPSPHTPVLPTPDFKGKSGLDSAYADFVTMTDDTVKQVLDALKEGGVDENTLFIFTSDNGCSPEADFAELEEQGHDPSFIYRGHKADIFEGGHRVPFIVRWPAKVKAGTSCDDPTCLTDLLATMAEVLGQKLPADAGEDSVSMLPNLIGESKQPVREAVVHHSINGTFAIRQGKWKLIDAPHSGGWSRPKPAQKALYKDLPKIQLYDLKKDPAESRNVSVENPSIVKKLKTLLEKYREDGRSVSVAR